MSLEYYNSIKVLPIKKFNKMQNMFLVNNGIGSTIMDFDNRLESMILYLKTDKKGKCLNEINNMRMLFNNIKEKRNPLHYAFLQLLKKKSLMKISSWIRSRFRTKKSSTR